MRFRRRRDETEPVVLPSLDRLSGLVERVVELVDAVGDTSAVPAPEPVAEPPQEAPAPAEAPDEAGWIAFVGSAHGYRLVERSGATPARGDTIELDGAGFRVVKLGRSPLPGDRRACVHVVGEEPHAEGRNPDA